jgi:hypothetical protein
VLYEGGTWACIREDYDARINTMHAMYVADTYLDGMSGATVCANALGRGDILSIVIAMTHSSRNTSSSGWLGKGWKRLRSGNWSTRS